MLAVWLSIVCIARYRRGDHKGRPPARTGDTIS